MPASNFVPYPRSASRALLPVAGFTIGNRLGLPFVDKPVNVNVLARAVQAPCAYGGIERERVKNSEFG